MNSLQKTFVFLSQIIRIPVIDSATGRAVGRAVDIAAALREMYPKVSALLVREPRGKKIVYVPWGNVKKVEEGRAVFVEQFQEVLAQNLKLSENEILLKETFWDKQIVDIAGSKVVRVNDLHLLREETHLWVVHMDVGFTGLLRRLGCLRFIAFLVRLVASYEMRDRFISWKFVQPVTPSIGAESLSLKVHHSTLSDLLPADLADIVSGLGTDERIAILKSMDNSTAAQTFQELPMKIRIQIAEVIGHERLAGIVNEMATDEAVDLLSHLSKAKTNPIFGHLPKIKVGQLVDLLRYQKHTAGSIMNTEFLTARQTDTAGAALENIKKELGKKESIYYIYVLEEKDALCGVVTLRQILTEAPGKPLSQFMRKTVVKVRADTRTKDVAEIFYKYDFTAVPVVDSQKKVQGVITMKDAFESVFRKIREEADEAKSSR